MSIISQGGGEQRRPSVVSTGGKKPAASAKPPAGGKSTTGKSGNRPAGSGGRSGKGPRKPIAPVKVSQGRNWGPIALFVAVGLLAAGIIGWGGWFAYKDSQPLADRVAAIDGLINYRDNPDKSLTEPGHVQGPVAYKLNPPVGGDHNPNWQNCMGDVYDAPIANEHAVHSMEHGAVWITYRSGLPDDQVAKLADKVRGVEYMLMSPVDNLDRPISLQAWGYQLKVDDADDARIAEFIKLLRNTAAIEPGAACSGGITATGTSPRDLDGGMQK